MLVLYPVSEDNSVGWYNVGESVMHYDDPGFTRKVTKTTKNMV